MTCTAAQLFGLLPTEIRLMIWSYILPGPRVVEINWNRNVFNLSESQHHDEFGILQISREAYEEYSRLWHPLFRSPSSEVNVQFRHGNSLPFFNPDIDTLYVGPTIDPGTDGINFEMLSQFMFADLIKHLAMESYEWEFMMRLLSIGRAKTIPFLAQFPTMETFTVAESDYDWNCSRRGLKIPDGVVQFVDRTTASRPRAPISLQHFDAVTRNDPALSPLRPILREVMRGGERMRFKEVSP